MRKKMVKVKNNSAKKSSTKKAPANKWWFEEFGDNLMKNAEEIFFKILDDEMSNKMPAEIIEEAKNNFNERLKTINWDTYCNDLPFNPSALSLYKWAPIADELKELDRKIVLNSVILKWNVVKKEFLERVKF